MKKIKLSIVRLSIFCSISLAVSCQDMDEPVITDYPTDSANIPEGD